MPFLIVHIRAAPAAPADSKLAKAEPSKEYIDLAASLYMASFRIIHCDYLQAYFLLLYLVTGITSRRKLLSATVSLYSHGAKQLMNSLRRAVQ